MTHKQRSHIAAFHGLHQWPSQLAKEWVFQFSERVCSSHNTRALIGIGSMVRPVKEVNDVDLLYIYERKPLAFDDHPLDVDVRICEASAVERLLAEGSDLLGWALKFGLLICERKRYWTDLHSIWGTRIRFPDPAVAEKRALQAERRYHEFLQMGDVEAAGEHWVTALTHQGWARLLAAKIYPASRQELPAQLRSIQENELASELEEAISALRLCRSGHGCM